MAIGPLIIHPKIVRWAIGVPEGPLTSPLSKISGNMSAQSKMSISAGVSLKSSANYYPFKWVQAFFSSWHLCVYLVIKGSTSAFNCKCALGLKADVSCKVVRPLAGM